MCFSCLVSVLAQRRGSEGRKGQDGTLRFLLECKTEVGVQVVLSSAYYNRLQDGAFLMPGYSDPLNDKAVGAGSQPLHSICARQ